MLSLNAMAYDFSYTYQGKTLYYDITSSNTVAVTYYSSDNDFQSNNYVSGDVVIPSSVTRNGTTYSVDSIGFAAFAYCSDLTSVIIPNSVTSTGNSVFYECSNLTSVTIPNSVTSIGYATFAYCSGLTSVTIPNSVTSIGNSAFYGCSSLSSVTIGNSVTSIGGSAFYDCSSLTSVTIPNSVNSIGDYAFRGCSSLTSITIPNSVTTIGNYAFGSCSSLTSVTIPNSVTSIGNEAFYNCSSLTSVTIPNSVTSIGYMAFYNCSSLTSVTIPNSVISIGNEAFVYCSSLTSVTIPNSVISIGEGAFYNCSSLNSVTIGSGLISIENYAFYGCGGLTSIVSNAVIPPAIGGIETFPYPNIATLTIPCGTLEAYTAPASYWNMFFAGRISERIYNIEVSVNDETFGSVSIEGDCPLATLTAIPNEGYRFVSWNDENTENPREVTLTSDTAFTAIFAAIDEASLSEAETESLSLYPNPTRDFVIIEFGALQESSSLRVTDLGGRVVKTFDIAAGTESIRLDLRDLPSGVYTLMIGNTTKKLIVE